MNASALSQPMVAAERAIRAALDANSPGRRLEELNRAYRLTLDKDAFAAVLIGHVVFADRALVSNSDGRRHPEQN